MILSRQKGVKSGGFMVSVDDRLRRTLAEVARLQEESLFGEGADPDDMIELAPEEPGTEGPASKAPRSSRLTPKDIQASLRAGRTVQEVARQAGTEIAWIERFVGPILAERKGIVDAVKAGVISRPRRGRSSTNVGDAIVANLHDRNINLSPEALDEAWKAIRRNGNWEVAFRYTVRGQTKEAQFAFDAETRGVKAINPMAMQIAWRAPQPVSEAEAPAPEPPAPPRPVPSLTARATPSMPRKAMPGQSAAPANAPPAPARGERTAPSRPPLRGPMVTEPAARTRPRPVLPGSPRPQSEPAPEPEASPVRPRRPASSPRGAGAADERPSFARRTSSPRPRRLVSEDDEAWKAALSKSRARKGSPAPDAQAPRQPNPRPAKKRLPDDWLLEP